ncbi:sporulation related protein [Aliiruegeria haliotis]|uniref:Sporulation related protein n=1 Tax=Aliiruegeria haliotis TaxID=1280846 RepID=A0A2T0RNB8_9RHOB|nr:SPOR domain-containing protein [Aliiruegeria haliotis]PRY22679.1 sporulation related protein [Aliiruegeria haliotis]
MGGIRLTLFIGASALALTVSGCMEGGSGTSDGSAEATAFSERPSSTRLVERDVEAPEVFQVTEKGLWDGRPSLGGVWVAHPDVTDPERVIIRNEANGKFVIGALFKREREHPGPKIQVSSDAAAALELLAGSPTVLNVTALRREEPEQPEEAITPAETEAVAEAEAPAESGDATIAGAAAAIDAAETGDGTESLAATTAAAETAAPAAPAKTKRSWNPFRRNKQPKSAIPVAATATTAVGTTVATEALATGDVSSAPLGGQLPKTTGGTTQAAKPAASAPAPKKTTSVDKPYVQIGIFSVEQNANNTATAMRQNGVVPKVFEQEMKGKKYWRVVVGPATSKSDRSVLLKKVKGMGFTDAYAVNG